MAKVKIQGHASGTGILTVTAPNTSTDRTITLPDSTDTLAVNSDVTNKLPLAGGTMTGTLNVNNTLPTIKLTDTDSGGYYSSVIQQGSSFKVLADEGEVGSGQIRFYVGSGAEKVRILSSGGITFNGDSAAANALDDYEEGTFTAGLTAVNGSITMNSSIDTGAYTKVGRVVHVQGRIAVASVSSCSGAVKMALPFTPASSSTLAEQSHYHMFAIFLEGIAYTAGSVAMGRIYDGSVGMQIVNVDSSNGAPNVDGALFGAGDEVRFTFSYLVD